MKKSLRVIISALHHFPDKAGGSVRLAYDEARYLANRGHEVWIVTQDVAHNQPEKSAEDGLNILRYPAPRTRTFDPRRRILHQKSTRELLEQHVPSPVDLIHGHSILQYEGALSSHYAKSARLCYSIHSPVPLELLASCRGEPLRERLRLWIASILSRRMEKRCLEASSELTAFSEYTRKLIKSLYGSAMASRIHTRTGWIDIGRFRLEEDRTKLRTLLGWPTDNPVFFTLRRLVPRMGLDNLLRALNIVRISGFRFHCFIGGSGPQMENLQNLTKQLELENRVHFAGPVSENDLPLMYSAADAFLLPTHRLECFGLISLEAMATGRPVLCTPVGAIPEVVGGFEPLWISRDAGVEAFAELVTRFLKGSLPDHSPEALHRFVAEHYSRDRVLKRFYDRILASQTAQQQNESGC